MNTYKSVLFLSMLLVFLSPMEARKKAKIHIEPTNINFDTIYYDNPFRTADVAIHNKGNETLYIYGIYPDCSCTIIENKIDSIKPGHVDTLKIKFRVNKLFPGIYTKNIYIKSNSKKEKETIVLKAEVRHKN